MTPVSHWDSLAHNTPLMAHTVFLVGRGKLVYQLTDF